MRVMGIDFGEKRVGIALSDALRITAQPYETIHFKENGALFEKISALIRENEVSEIVVGLPLNMNGLEGPQAQKVRDRAEEMRRYLAKRGCEPKIHFWDERLSTVAAERVLIDADLSRAKRKLVIDKAAASYMLQGWLDQTRPLSEEF